MTSDEIREQLPELLRGARPQAPAVRVADPAAHDPSTLLITAGMHPLKPYFTGRETPPHHRLTTLPEVLPHAGHRQGRHHHAPPDVLRDARQLLDRRLLQAGRGRVRVGVLARAASASTPSGIWVTVFEGDDELGLGPDEEAIEAWLAIGVPRERIVAAAALGELLAGGPDRAVRAVLASSTSTAGSSSASEDDLPGRRQRALPRVLEPRVHAVRPGPEWHADAAAGAEHRHRARPQPPGRDPAGHRLGLRDRPVPAADRARRGAQRQALRRRTPRSTARCASSPTTRAACRS